MYHWNSIIKWTIGHRIFITVMLRLDKWPRNTCTDMRLQIAYWLHEVNNKNCCTPINELQLNIVMSHSFDETFQEVIPMP